jgi:hypothetical protein
MFLEISQFHGKRGKGVQPFGEESWVKTGGLPISIVLRMLVILCKAGNGKTGP